MRATQIANRKVEIDRLDQLFSVLHVTLFHILPHIDTREDFSFLSGKLFPFDDFFTLLDPISSNIPPRTVKSLSHKLISFFPRLLNSISMHYRQNIYAMIQFQKRFCVILRVSGVFSLAQSFHPVLMNHDVTLRHNVMIKPLSAVTCPYHRQSATIIKMRLNSAAFVSSANKWKIENIYSKFPSSSCCVRELKWERIRVLFERGKILNVIKNLNN